MTTPANQRLVHAPTLRCAPVERATADGSEHVASATGFGIDLTTVPVRSTTPHKPEGPSASRDSGTPAATGNRDGGANQAIAAAQPAVTNGIITPGTPLDPDTRTEMEARFGHDFGAVRTHTGPAADTSARALRARAYAVGNDVVFREGTYQPDTAAGAHLLAHELAHVVQQNRGVPATAAVPVSAMEDDAHRAAAAGSVGEGAIRVTGESPVRVACQDEDEPPTYGNIHGDKPSDNPRRVRLVNSGGHWYAIDVMGRRKTAKGTYAFVILSGHIWAVVPAHNDDVDRGHTEAALGRRVEFAGTVTFGKGSTNRGQATSWTNQSGHYRPIAGRGPQEAGKDPRVGVFGQTAVNAGLPADRFRPFVYSPADPETRKQLPVLQPPQGATIIPRQKQAPDTPQPTPTDSTTTEKPSATKASVESTQTLPFGSPKPPDVTATVWTIDRKLLANQQSAAVWRDFNRDIVAMINAEESRHEAAGILLPPERAAIRERAQAAAEAAEKRYTAAAADLSTLRNSTTPPEKLADIIARHNVPVTPTAGTGFATGDALLREQADKLGRLPSGWSLDSKGSLVSTGTVGTTAVSSGEGGTPRSTTTEESRSARIGLAGAGNTTGTKTTTVQGETSSSAETSKTKDYNRLQVNPGYTGTATTKTTDTDAAGVTNTKTTAATTTVDTGGIGRTTTASTQRGSALDSTTTSLSLKRGDGTLTVGGSKETKSGSADSEGALTQGVTTSRSASGGLTYDKDKGTGLGGDLAGGATYVPAKGISIGLKVGAGGRWYVNVEPVPGSTERFLITTTIVLSGSISLTGSAEKDLKALGLGPENMRAKDLKFGVSGGITGSAAAQATFAHELGAAEAKQYLDLMAAKGEGGALPEHRLLATGFKHGWTAAQDLYRAMLSPEGLAVQASGLGKGEYREKHTESSTGATAAVNVTAGGFGVGGSGGTTSKNEVTARIAGNDDQTVTVSLTVNHIDSTTGGGTLKMGFAGGAVGVDSGVSAGRVYSFRVQTADTATQKEMLSATTLEELYRLSGKYSKLVAGSSELRGSTAGEKVGVSVGGANVKLGGSSAYNEKVDYDASGQRAGATYTGSSTTGGSVGLGEIGPDAKSGLDVGDSRSETFTGEVEERGGASGEQVVLGKSQHTAAGFNLRKTVAAAKRQVAEDPLKLITSGASGVVQTETTEDRTLYFGREDYDHIVAAAHDTAGWMSHVVSARVQPEWRRAMVAIRAASKWVEPADGTPAHWTYDANAVQQALAKWTASNEGARLDAVEYLVRPANSGSGGVQGALPGPLAAYESDFKKLVVRDPIAESKTLAAADREDAAQIVSQNEPVGAEKGTDPDTQQGVVAPVKRGDPSKPAALYRTALTDLRAVEKRLGALGTALAGNEKLFATRGVYAEMFGQVEKRITAVRSEIRATEDKITHLEIDARAAAAATAPQRTKAEKAEATKVLTGLEEERRRAATADAAKGAQTAQLEARVKFDQMWRASAAINGLLDKVRQEDKAWHPDYKTMNLDMANANQQLRDWRSLRERNGELVHKYGLGQWLLGPEPAQLQAAYDSVYSDIRRMR